MLTLGLSGNFGAEDVDLVPGMPDYFFHDATACLVHDGVLVAAVEEERLNRIKKTTKFPVNAIRYCLQEAGASYSDVDAVGYYFRQDFTDHSLNSMYLENPQLPALYSRQLIQQRLDREFGWELPDDRLFYITHHIGHALSSYVRSGMDDALAVVLDARGEDESGTVFRAVGGELETLTTFDLSKSLGTLYESAVHMLAYRFGDEYKVMGLAPYGNPATYRNIFDTMYSLEDKGDYSLSPAMPEFDPVGSTFYPYGVIPRRKGGELTQAHKDFAASLQETLERIVLHILNYWSQSTGLRKLCFAGGVAHNSSLNGRILRSGIFEEIFVHPASHDAGAAEGAALGAVRRLGSGTPRQPRLRSASLGPGLDKATIEQILGAWSPLVEFEQAADVVEQATTLLADGQVLGWAQGRSEFGPRALGNRSIIADARPSENKNRINGMVKNREGYRPFAPVVTAEAASTYFDLTDTEANHDFMSFVVDVRGEHRTELGAVTHVDGTARVQVIDAASNERFHRLVEAFGERTGTPVLLNTSFNNSTEPIVQSVEDILTAFVTTDLDALVIDDFVVRRREKSSFDGFVLRFRPVTRLVEHSRPTPDDTHQTTREIYLDYSTGPRAEVSEELFTLLRAADGSSTLDSLARRTGDGLSDELRKELHTLWQERFFTLTPTFP